MKPTSKFLFFCSLALAITGPSASVHADSWTITDLGAQGSRPTGSSAAYAINSSGQVAGMGSFAQGVSPRPALWSAGVQTDFGTVNGGKALGINDFSQIVGWTNSGNSFRPFSCQNGVFTQLGLLPGGTMAQAKAVNNSGMVVGVADFPWQSGTFFDQAAVLWINGVPTQLGAPDAVAINDVGQVLLVDASVAGGSKIWTSNSLTPIVIPSVEIFGSIQAAAINNSGHVVGAYIQNELEQIDFQAFLWKDGVATDLTGLAVGYESWAYDINNRGQAVGYARKNQITSSAVLWNQGAVIDLSSLPDVLAAGWVLTEARAVNDRGQIVGTGIRNGTTRAFLLTPLPSLTMQRDHSQLILTWTNPAFSLQSTLDPAKGPWASVAGTSPVTVPIATGKLFYRLAAQ